MPANKEPALAPNHFQLVVKAHDRTMHLRVEGGVTICIVPEDASGACEPSVQPPTSFPPQQHALRLEDVIPLEGHDLTVAYKDYRGDIHTFCDRLWNVRTDRMYEPTLEFLHRRGEVYLSHIVHLSVVGVGPECDINAEACIPYREDLTGRPGP